MEALQTWLRGNGERALNVAGSVFMWGAAAHAAYILLLPALLRPVAARRNSGRAMAASVAALMGVGLYDLAQTSRIESDRAALAAEYRRLTKQAVAEEAAAAGPAAARNTSLPAG